jgi:predicted RNA-binding protein YlqC (UPF0109 family)
MAKEFLEFIIKNIVKNPDKITITQEEDELWILLSLKVDPSDMWIVIWKSWNTVNAIRTVLKTVWLKSWKRINLKVLD